MKFLIVKTSSLGDIIQAFPVAAYLRKKFPEAQLDWVVERPYAELITAHPYVDRALTVDTKAWRKSLLKQTSFRELKEFLKNIREHSYDAVFDLQANTKSGLVVSSARSKEKVGYGWRHVRELPNLLFTNRRFDLPTGENIREDYLLLIKNYFGDRERFEDQGIMLEISKEQKESLKRLLQTPSLAINDRKVLVCPGSAWINKQMTAEALMVFLSKMQEYLKCSFLFAWGTQQEKLMVESFQRHFMGTSEVLDRLPLPMLQNLMNEVDLVVAMDSLPLHLAGTTATPTYSVFGASSAGKYKPQGKRHYAFQGPCPYGITFEKRCPKLRTCTTGTCIRGLTGHEVFQSFHAWHCGFWGKMPDKLNS
jgi:heptosyltransferase I